MQKLKPSDLFSLEQYSKERPAIRAKVMEHKRSRQVGVGPNLMWLFEARITIQYQVQEMLRAERIFEQEGIEDELGAYNPLIPDGNNWNGMLQSLPQEGTADTCRCENSNRRPDSGIDGCWLGRKESNLRMAESKSAALPLGYAPKRDTPSNGVWAGFQGSPAAPRDRGQFARLLMPDDAHRWVCDPVAERSAPFAAASSAV